MVNMSNRSVDGYGSSNIISEDEVKNIVEVQQRKASDILLALEAKVETLMKLVYNQDMLLKLIADRTNKMYTYIDELQKEYKESKNQKLEDNNEDQEDPRIINISNDHQITEAKERVGQSRIVPRAGPNVVPVPQPAILAIPNQQLPPNPQQAQQTTGSDKKVPVVQRVSDHTGKDIFMCQVLILDESGNEITKTKTNAVGKWQAMLKPAPYTIKITKTDTATKKMLETTQKITIQSSNSTITLPVVIMNR